MSGRRTTPGDRSTTRSTPRNFASSGGDGKPVRLSSEIQEAVRVFDDVAEAHDGNDASITELLGLIADNAHATYEYRNKVVGDCKEDLHQWMERSRVAQERAADMHDLEEARKELQALEIERQDVIQEILSGTEETKALEEKKEQLRKKERLLEKTEAQMQERRERELPTLEYLEKVLKRVSNTTILSTRKSGKIEGVVSKPGTQDLLPFSYDREMSTFDRVNKHWDLISESE